MNNQLSIQRMVSARLPVTHGEFRLVLYTNNLDNKEHLALVLGDVSTGEPVLARIHSECFTGDVLGSQRCDCGEQLDLAMQKIASEGRGVIVYLRQEGRGIGLAEKLKAYNLQDSGLDTIDANLALGHPVDDRDYSMAIAILRDLGVTSVRLMTNNPGKIQDLEENGIPVVERITLVSTVYKDNYAYLLTKAQRMNHKIDMNNMGELFMVRAANPKHGNARIF
jgi:3,4-dihydroxy 2-butanone 4-phosphate synthase / GTP cyclohydrolase II